MGVGPSCKSAVDIVRRSGRLRDFSSGWMVRGKAAFPTSDRNVVGKCAQS